MSRRSSIFFRSLSLRCPNCGGRGLFRHWLAMKEVCPNCGHSLASGNRVGANLLNLVAAEILLMIGLLTVVVRSWPDPPWNLLQYGAPAMMIIMPLLLYPFSKLLFVGIDLAMYPEGQPDALVHGKGIGELP